MIMLNGEMIRLGARAAEQQALVGGAEEQFVRELHVGV
jgi:hypothetical protein